MDLARIENAVRDILSAVGEDPDREGVRNTPSRVARMYEELFSGLGKDPARHLETRFTETYDEMVVLRDIPFNSMCEHHLMPFEGRAHVAYLPNGQVVGISKLARVVDEYAHRPQVQERLTSQVANLLMEKLQAKGVAVVMTAMNITPMLMLMSFSKTLKPPNHAMSTPTTNGPATAAARISEPA